MTNRRTLEFTILAGLLGLGMPVSVLMGVQAGEKTAAAIYPPPDADPVGMEPAGSKLYLTAGDLMAVVHTLATPLDSKNHSRAAPGVVPSGMHPDRAN